MKTIGKLTVGDARWNKLDPIVRNGIRVLQNGADVTENCVSASDEENTTTHYVLNNSGRHIFVVLNKEGEVIAETDTLYADNEGGKYILKTQTTAGAVEYILPDGVREQLLAML